MAPPGSPRLGEALRRNSIVSDGAVPLTDRRAACPSCASPTGPIDPVHPPAAAGSPSSRSRGATTRTSGSQLTVRSAHRLDTPCHVVGRAVDQRADRVRLHLVGGIGYQERLDLSRVL